MRTHLLRTLARASARNGTAATTRAAAAPQSWRRLATSPLATDAVNLDLSQAKALTCHNMMCEHVGEPCGCRIAAFLERRSFPKLETLSLRGAGLRAVPDAVLRLPRLNVLRLPRLRGLDADGPRGPARSTQTTAAKLPCRSRHQTASTMRRWRSARGT